MPLFLLSLPNFTKILRDFFAAFVSSEVALINVFLNSPWNVEPGQNEKFNNQIFQILK